SALNACTNLNFTRLISSFLIPRAKVSKIYPPPQTKANKTTQYSAQSIACKKILNGRYYAAYFKNSYTDWWNPLIYNRLQAVSMSAP
ncbi:MAG: hypothetical protein MSA38_00540, partial [Bacteroidales bacterium]|nr:hypothetical protein [Bacteroidales bacterium]